ncbi:DUF92 domain-containing protein [Paenibacillus agricola]|uniref:DUF92 domain-containing protein n=1 Tax=Paenibacillus agricola TaxID=2716264 RepID=A0ABX0J7Z9_9BACL|nr:DUF92 domain-containing protein [Paenibacillus agricola]NHN31294.1 DUF92 domain-containing protein [Paenibacillus agricola]
MASWIIGLVCSAIIAAAAWRKRSLSNSGAIAAIIVGSVLYALGGLPWYGTLLLFFISSSLLTKWKHKRKADVESSYAKSGRRDAGQVAANGGIGVLLCIGNSLWPDPLWWVAYIGIMAAVNADTWATEIGGLSRAEPRSIVSGRRVPAGTSGGITRMGLTASLCGGMAIGGAGWLFTYWGAPEGGSVVYAGSVTVTAVMGFAGMLLMGAFAGMAGSLSDSWLGAVWQVMYRCPVCGKEIEKNRHCQDQQAVRIRGASFMTNDAVNLLSSLVGGGVSLAFIQLFI